MNNQDTPETDEEERTEHDNQGSPYPGGIVDAEFARKLERERNQWKSSHDHVCKELAACENARDENAALWDNLREAIRETLMENLHLADGDVCTLKRLKDSIGFELPET